MNKLRRALTRLDRDNKGFTMIELLVVIVISGVIAAVIAATILQLNETVVTNRNKLTATNWQTTAQNWIQTDVKMAQQIQTGTKSGFPLELSWVVWGGTQHRVTYKLDPTKYANDLQRVHQIGRSGSPPSITETTLVAEHVVGTATATIVESGSGVHEGNTLFTLTVELAGGTRRV